MKKNWKLYLALFWETFKISVFTFGGGYVIVSLMKKQFADKRGWIDEKEMLDFTAIAQSSPGSIAVNAAILVGWRVGGAAGIAIAVLGTLLPPMLILSMISFFYAAFASNRYVALTLRGMQAGVAAVILDVVCGLGSKVVKEHSALSIALMLCAFAATFFFKINVVFILLAAALVGAVKLLVIRLKEVQA